MKRHNGKIGRAPFQIHVSNVPPAPLHSLQSLGGCCGSHTQGEREEQGLHQGCSLDRANKSRPVTCSMAPFEEWGKFGQSQEKGFSLEEQLTAHDRQEAVCVYMLQAVCVCVCMLSTVLEVCAGTLNVVVQLTLWPLTHSKQNGQMAGPQEGLGALDLLSDRGKVCG